MHFTGHKAFNLLWFSQTFSLLGSTMTRFALMIWAYQTEGTATALALLGFSVTITFVIASPIAGVFVDRWDRRKVMFFSDLGAGLMTALVLALFTLGKLQLWHLFLMEGVAGGLEAFQNPAFYASVSLLVPRDQYIKANARLALGQSAARIVAPSLASLLLSVSGLPVVMLVDLVTMSLALAALFFIFIPVPEVSEDGSTIHKEPFFKQLAFGFRYIFQRPGLRSILVIFFLVNLFAALAYYAMLSPMILARTGGDEKALGLVQTVMGIGGVVGGLVMSVYGKTKRKARTFAIFTMFSFMVCDFLMGISSNTLTWCIAGFLSDFSIPFMVSPYYAIWQELIPADVQGKVFSTREMIQMSSMPLGYLFAGFIADKLLEPALQTGGALAGSLGLLVGTGHGAGMSSIFLFTSFFGMLTGLAGLLLPTIRNLDKTNA